MSTYGISRYGPPTLYGKSRAARVVPGGTTLPLINNAYLIDPFNATAIDYESILLTWNGPDQSTNTPMNGFRLLSSRYGFPVDENDGNILFNTTGLPGQQYVDQNVVPGEITYYGFYILGANNTFIRAGFTAALMPVFHGYGNRMFSELPEYLRSISDGDLTSDAAGNTFLNLFLDVAGFSLDYLKTQYDFLYNNQNDPLKISFADLAQLAGEVGMPFSAEIPSHALRKAVDNWAVVMRQRGSLAGISEHMSLLSGYGADVQISRNIMLEDDQSLPLDPGFNPWQSGVPYKAGEIVSWPVYPEWVVSATYVVNNFVVYNGVNYQAIATGGTGVPPTGAVSSSTFWTIASGPFDYVCIKSVTSLPGTSPPAAPVAGATPNPGNATWHLVFDNDSRAPYNNAQAYTQGQFVMSGGNIFVCTATTSTGSTPPSANWALVGSAASDYLTIPGLVSKENTWEVLGATSGATTPSTAGVATGTLMEGLGTHNPANFANDLSQNTFRVYNRSGATQDQWLRSVSRQASDITNASAVPDQQLVIEHGIPVPQTNSTDLWSPTTRYGTGAVVLFNFVNYVAQRASTGAQPPALGSTSPEWLALGRDERIPLTISAQTSQNFSQSGTIQFPIFPFVEWYDNWGELITRVFARTLTGYTFDSFTSAPGALLNARETDTQDHAWTANVGAWLLDGSGNAYPSGSGVKSIATVQAPLTCTQAVTFTEAPQAGVDAGLIFWFQSTSIFWHAGTSALWSFSGGAFTNRQTYAASFHPGDRIYVQTNQATPSITVFRNVVGAFNATTGNGQVAQLTGAGVPVAALPGGSTTVFSGIASEAV